MNARSPLALVACTSLAAPAALAQEPVQFEADMLFTPREQQDEGHWFGWSLGMSGDWAVVGDYAGSTSAHFFQREPDHSWSHRQTVHGKVSSAFGISVAIDGSIAVVGAENESSKGKWKGTAFVYELSPSGNWELVDELAPENPMKAQFFGGSVGVSGDTIVVGMSGLVDPCASIFERRGPRWELVFTGRLPDIPDVQNGILKTMGSRVAIDGDVVASSAGGYYGAVFVYERGPIGWHRVAMLEDPTQIVGDGFGFSVAIQGSTLVVGEPVWDYGARPGSAFIFERSGAGQWDLLREIRASDGYATSEWTDQFGQSVAVGGDYVLVGMPNSNANGERTGGGYLFHRGSTGWPQYETQKLLPRYPSANERAGQSAAVEEGFCMVGAPDRKLSTMYGGTYVYGTEQGAALCPGAPNTTGEVASLAVAGSDIASDRTLTLLARDVPKDALTWFLVDSSTSGAGGVPGELCLGRTRIPLHREPRPGAGHHAIFHDIDFDSPWIRSSFLSGTTWYFQAEYQEVGPAGVRNHTNAIELALE